MARQVFNKLVRDGIPDKIKRSGDKVKYKNVQGEELVALLVEKMSEESLEVQNAHANFQRANIPHQRRLAREKLIAELADVQAVYAAILKKAGIGAEEVAAAEARKFKEVGGFEEGVFLIETT